MRHVQQAWQAAQRILETEKVKRAPVDVDKIARRYAKIQRRPLGEEISGMLIPVDDSWVIVVNEDHPEVRQRFTVAHELAHIVLHGYKTPHADRGFIVRFRNQLSTTGKEIEEIQANEFAAALLMPRELLQQHLVDMRYEYDATSDTDDSPQLREVAKAFNVSRQALSLRLGAFGVA